jgi:hypothetical protein
MSESRKQLLVDGKPIPSERDYNIVVRAQVIAVHERNRMKQTFSDKGVAAMKKSNTTS